MTLTHAWTFDIFSFVQQSWSISIEFLYYLIFAFMILLLSPRLALAVFATLATFYGAQQSGVLHVPDGWTMYLNHRIFSYGAFFTLGVCVRYMAEMIWVRRLLDNNVAAIVLSAALFGVAYTAMPKLMLISFLIPLLVRSCHTSRIADLLLGNPIMVWFGEISYSMYLSHLLIFQMVQNLYATNPFPLPKYSAADFWAATYALLFVWCFCCYHLIELPARVKLRSLYRI